MKQYNRYLVFGGYQYYPEGGINDLILPTNDKDKAISIAKKAMNNNKWKNKWCHVYDQEDNAIIYQEESE